MFANVGQDLLDDDPDELLTQVFGLLLARLAKVGAPAESPLAPGRGKGRGRLERRVEPPREKSVEEAL